jgi:hypothetical protein
MTRTGRQQLFNAQQVPLLCLDSCKATAIPCEEAVSRRLVKPVLMTCEPPIVMQIPCLKWMGPEILTVFLNDAGGEWAGHSDRSCVSTGAMVSNTPSRLISLWKRMAATCIRMMAKKAKAR